MKLINLNMEMNEIFKTIQELCAMSNKRDELRQLCNENIEQILNGLPHRILKNDGGNVLSCIFNGFSDNSPITCKIKVKMVDLVLKVMRKQSTSLSHCSDVLSWLCLELPRLPVQDLVRWSDESVQTIVEDSDVNMIWRDILPEAMYTILSHATIKHCGTELSSEEYKEQCIRTLCQCQWKDRQIVPLVSMFKDLQLNQNDHRKVVNKICSYIIDTPPDTLPPLVHQLLKLCKSRNLEIVLAHLSYYYTIRLYSRLEPPAADSESTVMDLEDIVEYSPAELSSSLSTCMYHISKGPVEPDLLKKHVRTWPKTQLLRNTFIVDLALAVSDKGSDFRTVCLNAVKLAVEQRILDEIRSKESAWVRAVIPPDVDIASLLKVLTTECDNHRQLTAMGLINLAFSLLAVNASRPTAISCWSHGTLILVRLSKSQPETVPHILAQLSDRIVGDCSQRQYAHCLYVLCKLTPGSVERCTQLTTILENCQLSPTDFKGTAAALDAVRPLLNFSTRTRDSLVMVCRKGLYSRSSLQRCLALSGFLTVLRNIKISGYSNRSSQSWNSDENTTFSYLTQLTVDFHASQQGGTVTSRVRNEAVCMEVISILRRCLVQDAAVKQLLYTKLFDCTKEKIALHELILELLNEHLSKYIGDDETAPLLLDKCIQQTVTNASLVEPISHLLYLVVKFLGPIEDEDDLEDILSSQARETSNVYLKNKLSAILEQLSSSEQLKTVDMDDPGLSDLTPESKAKNLKVQQILQCYEVFIAYKIMQWKTDSVGVAENVYQLYRSCHNIIEQTKTPVKSKKGSKSINETRETKSQKSQKSQKDKSKGPTKSSNTIKNRAGAFKPLPCLWDIKFCLRVMQLLYTEDVAWSSVSERNTIRGRRDFHHWALRCVLSALTADLEKRVVAVYVLRIATILYERCICRFEDMCTFDDETALLCVEVFKACLHLLFSTEYSLKMDIFLPKIINQSELTPPACIAKILEKVHNAIIQVESDTVEERDGMGKKLMGTLCGLAGTLLVIPVASCVEMSNVIIKFEDFLRRSNLDCLSLISPVLTAGCREQQEAQFLDDLLKKLTTTLGIIDESEDESNESLAEFPVMDTVASHAVLIQVCLHLNTRFEFVEHLLNRARDLASAEQLAVGSKRDRISKEYKELYKSIILQLYQLCSWTSTCAKLRCSVGAPSDKVLATCVTLYRILSKLAKQIDVATAQILHFERLLRLSGKKLSSLIDNLISYVESSQEQANANKVLRRTKLIPALVYEAEQFSNEVITKANKAKMNWQQYLSLGTARDFRIKVPLLQEALRANDNEENDSNDIDDENEVLPSEREDERDDEGATPKRRRVS